MTVSSQGTPSERKTTGPFLARLSFLGAKNSYLFTMIWAPRACVPAAPTNPLAKTV
jgi:hypothetical protein